MTRRTRVLVTSYYNREVIAPALAGLGDEGFEVIDGNRGRNLTAEEMLEAVPGIHVTIAADEPYTEEVLDVAGELLLIARDGTGYENIDLAAATERGIIVTRAPVVHHATANMAMGLMIALVRKITVANEGIRAGKWMERDRFLCPDLTGMTLGIVGFGIVGREVATRAAAMGMKLLVHDIADVTGHAYAAGARVVGLDELLAASDMVTVHIRHTKETAHLFSAGLFAKMKKGAYFVNTSRGGIVREADLVEALRTGHLAGAALDVFGSEPVEEDNALLAMENVVATPHVAGDTSTTMLEAFEINVAQILDILAVKEPTHLLNKEVWEKARIHEDVKEERA